jgi:hypothetical protein
MVVLFDVIKSSKLHLAFTDNNVKKLSGLFLSFIPIRLSALGAPAASHLTWR